MYKIGPRNHSAVLSAFNEAKAWGPYGLIPYDWQAAATGKIMNLSPHTQSEPHLHSRQLSREPSFHFLLSDPSLLHKKFKPINNFILLYPFPLLHPIGPVCSFDSSDDTQRQEPRELIWAQGNKSCHLCPHTESRQEPWDWMCNK